MLIPLAGIAAGQSPQPDVATADGRVVSSTWAGSGLAITNRQSRLSVDDLVIDLDITAQGLPVRCNGRMVVELAVETPAQRFLLPTVVYSGGIRAIYEERRRALFDGYSPEPYHTYDRMRKREVYELNYKLDIPSQAWMEGAALTWRKYEHDCSGDRLVEQGVVIERLNGVARPVYVAELPPQEIVAEPAPEIVIEPAPEPVVELPEPDVTPIVIEAVPEEILRNENIRTAVLSLPIMYPVDDSEVLPWYGDNRTQLARIDSLFSALLDREHNHAQIEWIDICGYASPEGGYAHNKRLARDRSEGFKRYLCMQDYPCEEAMDKASVNYVAEDWQGLERLVEQGYIIQKEAALAIIRNQRMPYDRREEALKRIEPWSYVYRVLLEEMFPRLRRIELTIYYTESEP